MSFHSSSSEPSRVQYIVDHFTSKVINPTHGFIVFIVYLGIASYFFRRILKSSSYFGRSNHLVAMIAVNPNSRGIVVEKCRHNPHKCVRRPTLLHGHVWIGTRPTFDVFLARHPILSLTFRPRPVVWIGIVSPYQLRWFRICLEVAVKLLPPCLRRS